MDQLGPFNQKTCQENYSHPKTKISSLFYVSQNDLLYFIKKNVFFFYILSKQKLQHTPQNKSKTFYLKTRIFRILLYLPKTKIFKNSFLYLSRNSLAQRKNISQYLFVKWFWFSLFQKKNCCTQLAFLIFFIKIFFINKIRRPFQVISNISDHLFF